MKKKTKASKSVLKKGKDVKFSKKTKVVAKRIQDHEEIATNPTEATKEEALESAYVGHEAHPAHHEPS